MLMRQLSIDIGAKMIDTIIFSALIMFLPGFLLVRFFYNEADIIEKIALSFGLSVAIVTLTVFYINFFFKIPIILTNILIIDFVICLTIFAVGSMLNRKAL